MTKNLRAKISDVEAEERVYHMIEEKDGRSDVRPVGSLVNESPSNPNVAEW